MLTFEVFLVVNASFTCQIIWEFQRQISLSLFRIFTKALVEIFFLLLGSDVIDFNGVFRC